MYKVMPKKGRMITYKIKYLIYIYHSKKAFIEEITSKTSEFERAG